jgi:hypothetical protein
MSWRAWWRESASSLTGQDRLQGAKSDSHDVEGTLLSLFRSKVQSTPLFAPPVAERSAADPPDRARSGEDCTVEVDAGEGDPDVRGRALDDRVTVTMPQPLGNASVSGPGVPGALAVHRGIIGS